MKLSRRHFLRGASAASILAATPAKAFFHGSAPQFSQRSVINLGFLFENDYAFINHTLQGDSSISPVSSAFTGADPIWTSVLDANGWPNSSTASGKVFGGGWRIPDPANFAGPYVITWQGDGTVGIGLNDALGGTATFTVNAGASSNYTELGNGSYTNTAGLTAKIVFSISTTVAGPRLLFHHISSTGTAGANFLKNLQIYRQADETDLLAGKVFRAPFKQSLVNLNPSAIRFLNWMSGSSAREYRFENRMLPSNAGYATNTNWTVSPVYPAASGTNIYSVGTATPTTSNPKTTPATYQHGEMASVLFTSSMVRCGTLPGISAMTNANPCQVTANGHGFSNGDKIVHWAMTGMGRLVFFPVTIANVTTNTYTIGVDTTNTTNYPPYVSGGAAAQYISIDVGTRGAKPMAWPTGDAPLSLFGNTITGGQYYPLVYDKNVSILGDGAGNLIPGAWMCDTNAGGCSASVPLEIMVALVNEVNALAVSQGINTPIHMWLPVPHTSLTSMDADYTSASDYALNVADVILNAGSSQRAGGYSALTAKANLFLEYSNETWNSAGGFWAAGYLARMGLLRWPTSGTTNIVDMYVLRSALIMNALGAGNSRLKRVLSGQGIAGFISSSLNFLRVNGSATPGSAGNFYLTDTLTVNGGFGIPINQHDCFSTATYFDADYTTYYGGTGAGSFTDDSALYAGTTPYSSPNQTQALANFVAAVKSGAGQSIDTYLNNSLSGNTASYAAAMKALGKVAINYEGGPDWQTAVGSNLGGVHVATAADSTFLIAALDSTQWRDAQVNYFNRTSQVAGSAMPSVFTYIGATGNQRWAYCMPDTYASGTEGQALLNSPVWVGMGARNQGLA